MTGQLPAVRYPRHPAYLDPYVEIPGPRLAVSFLMMFGGSQLTFPNDPGGRSAAETLIGPERLRALGARMRDQKVEIPLPRNWLIPPCPAWQRFMPRGPACSKSAGR